MIALAPLPHWSDAVLELTRSHRVGHLAPPQRLVFALLVRTFQAYRGDRWVTAFGWIMLPCFALVGAVIGFVVVGGAYAGLAAVAPWFDFPTPPGLFALPLFLFTFAGWSRWRETERPVEFHREGGRIDGFELGRLHEVFEASEPSTLGLFFGMCFGVQVGLLTFVADLVGLPPSRGVAEATLLTLDNTCHGLFLDTFELYRLHWGVIPEHTFWSATLFYGFRIAFDAFALLAIGGGYRRYRLRHLFRVFPHDPRRLADLLDWIDARTGDSNRWPRVYCDEFLFLMLAKEYLRGNLGFVRHLSRQLPWLAIDSEVRAIFVGPDSQTTLRGAGSRGGRPA